MNRVPEPADARQSANHLAGLLRADREATANFVVALAEFDRHRHWVELGYNCLFNFVHKELRMSRSAAFFRTKAAEIVQRYPEVVEPLRDGRLCLTAVAQLAKVITDGNRAEILPRFFERSNQAAKELVAELAPVLNPPRRELVTALSSITSLTPGGATSPRLVSAESSSERLAMIPAGEDQGNRPAQGSVGTCAASNDSRGELPVARQLGHEGSAADESRRGSMDSWTEPLTDDMHRLHVTVTRDFLRKLSVARNALAHRRPNRDPHSGFGWRKEVLEAGLDLILRRDARNKGITARPQKVKQPCAPDHIPAHVRRVVGDRDSWQCQYPLDSGGICGSTSNVQFDHIRPDRGAGRRRSTT